MNLDWMIKCMRKYDRATVSLYIWEKNKYSKCIYTMLKKKKKKSRISIFLQDRNGQRLKH